jgi:FkbM family methyltransferase
MLPELEIVKTKSGLFCLFKNDDLIGKSLRDVGSFAEKEAHLAITFAKRRPGSLVLDIGANLGAFAIPVGRELSGLGGSGINVHCFEPQRTVHLQLCTNVFINRLSNVMVYNVAVGHQNSEISIPVLDFERSRNPGGFSVDPSIRKNLTQSAAKGITASNFYSAALETVDQVALDSLSFEAPIAFIKLDVEGHELECLKGATKTLQDSLFPPIVLEDWGSKFDWYREKSSQLRSHLTEDLGYILESIGGRELLAQHPKHPLNTSEFSR